MTPLYPDLDGAPVLVTGGASGIGAALVAGFAAQGARVALLDRDDAGAVCADLADARGGPPLALRCDVTDPEALADAVARAAGAHGPAQVLVCNAANDMRRPTLEVTPAQWSADIAVNLTHCLTAAQAVLPAMRAAGRGAIVNLTSVAYMMGLGGMAAYTAAKAGIVGLTRSLARDFGPDGVRVNAVAPGMVLTERQLRDWLTPEGMAAHLARQCLPRHLLPEDMVGPVLFLASAASAAVAGQTLIADGGVVFGG